MLKRFLGAASCRLSMAGTCFGGGGFGGGIGCLNMI
jgi:hypothetical protein